MLVSFKVSNFLSFNKLQSFSMIPSIEDEKKNHLINVGNVKLLKLALIFGANQSGKSNLLKAMQAGIDIILNSSPLKYQGCFCKIEKDNKDNETLFEFSFYKNDIFYTYGFTINLNKGIFLSEYLYKHNLENDQEELIFERITKANVDKALFSHRIHLDQISRNKLNKIINTFNNTETSLFITYYNNLKEDELIDCINVYKFFFENVIVNFQLQDFKLIDLDLINNKNEIIRLLNNYDCIIDDFIFEEVDINVLSKMYPEIIINLKKNLSAKEDNKIYSVVIKHSLYVFEKKHNELKISKVLLKHKNIDLEFDFSEESDGARRLFDLLEVLLTKKKEVIFLFDELNRYIHPLLLIKFIEEFNNQLENKNIQLVFTTHEVNILKEDLIRRDEVWFVERGRDNSSKVYSLDIFKLSKKRIIDSYLDGNFGAIPIFIEDT